MRSISARTVPQGGFMKPIIRLGMVGLGGIAQHAHLPGVERSPDLELTAICDIDEVKLQLVGDRYGIDPSRRFTDYRDLIRCEQVDAVDICTPNDVHFEVALAAAKAKKPYACEKPVTMTAEQADTLAACTKENRVPNMICFSYRFKPAARYAKDIIERGLLGRLYHVNATYYQAWGLPEANTPLVWRFIRERTGSGALGDLGCHALDLARFITGLEVRKVVSHAGTFVHERNLEDGKGTGKVDVDDFFNYLCELDGETSASFLISRFGFGRGNYQRVEIYGSLGSLIYKLDEKPEMDELEVCIGQPQGEAHVFTPLTVPGKFRVDQMQSFADIIRGCGDGLAAEIEDGRRNQHVLDALLTSHEEQRWVEVRP